VVWRVPGPAGVDADAVCLLRDLVDELHHPEGVRPKRKVETVLLYGADSDDGDWCVLILQPVLEGWPG